MQLTTIECLILTQGCYRKNWVVGFNTAAQSATYWILVSLLFEESRELDESEFRTGYTPSLPWWRRYITSYWCGRFVHVTRGIRWFHTTLNIWYLIFLLVSMRPPPIRTVGQYIVCFFVICWNMLKKWGNCNSINWPNSRILTLDLNQVPKTVKKSIGKLNFAEWVNLKIPVTMQNRFGKVT